MCVAISFRHVTEYEELQQRRGEARRAEPRHYSSFYYCVEVENIWKTYFILYALGIFGLNNIYLFSSMFYFAAIESLKIWLKVGSMRKKIRESV